MESGWKFVVLAASLAMDIAALHGAQAQPKPNERPASMTANSATELNEQLRIDVQRQDRVAVERAIASGADMRYRDAIGNTPLHNAVIFLGDPGVIAKMLAAGADPNAPNGDGTTPLCAVLAARYRHDTDGPQRVLAVVELLLARGATIKAAEAGGKSVLSEALEYKYPPLTKVLVKAGAQWPNDALLTALGPLGDNHPELLRLLMDVATPAQVAARQEDGSTPLHLAAAAPKSMPVLRWLVSRKADIHATTKRGMTPFAEASFHGNLEAMKYLAGLGAKMTVDEDAATPLHLAAYHPRPQPLQWLIEQGADTSAKDRWGRRALDIALDSHDFAFRSDADRLALVTLLGGTRADVARGTFHDHPLHLAVQRKDIDEVRRLLESGADPNVKNESADTPLRRAIELSSELPATPAERKFGARLLPLLIEHGARSDLRMGGAELRTYDEFARDLRIADLFERTRRRYAPRPKQ
jgi:ankyrin repeat protein